MSCHTCFVLKLGQRKAAGPVNRHLHGFGHLPELNDSANASTEQDHCAGLIVQQVQEDDQLHKHTSNDVQLAVIAGKSNNDALVASMMLGQ